MPRHIDPNALATSGYPYAASQPLAPYQQGSQAGAATYDPTGLDRTTSATGRYECSWCGKGFTRPSSLKIHMNTHTGERPYVCPFEGCGRSFSVQSNMRRHARVHTRNADSQADQDQDDEDEDDEVGSGSQSRSHSRGDSGSQPSSNGHGGHPRS
ncbi:hypothetical protein PHLGIDRAFT_64854 [Phlebiopsis gigantea 11061_1 CR5-6]|uniref:C2H2-type domain-containing protein n=1 Tax=Phlebiopsis gigantea (strain 11061_1 CR5-6) TaxID=745531 RepID=A0A0C3S4V4_PHLG1|nr:hypothetical protein PHLGIDRAFT_64854 [Phlebiopsis gigantea 11061_1 CR5-6]